MALPRSGRSIAAVLLVFLVLSTVAGCNKKGSNPPGGGGGGDFSSIAGPNGGVISGLNVALEITFSKLLLQPSISSESIQVVTVNDPAGASTVPAGIVGSLDFAVQGNILLLQPTVDFTPSNIIYGLVADALYEISFAPPGSGASILSVNGETLTNANFTYFFRTPSKGADGKPGYPTARAFLVDDPGGVVLPGNIPDANGDGDLVDEVLTFFGNPLEIVVQVPALELPVAPVRDILFIFDEAVLPETVVNVIDGSSPTISVQFNTVPAPGFAPKAAPAELSVMHEQVDATIVRWKPQFQAWPPGGFLFVEVTGLVQDLACNTKSSLTGSGVPDMFVQIAVASDDIPDTPPIIEPFTNNAKEDPVATSAEWAAEFPGLLGPVFGGGTAIDGVLLLDNTATAQTPASTVVPADAVIDYSTRTLRLPTVREVSTDVFEPRTWDFSVVDIPSDWTVAALFDRDADGVVDPDEFRVQSPGHRLDGLGAPLVIRATGNLVVQGVVDVTGATAESAFRPEGLGSDGYDEYDATGAPGGAALLAAGDGAQGGDVLMLRADGTAAVSLSSPAVTFPGLGFQAADPKTKGVTGRSSALSADTLIDTDANLSALAVGHGAADPGLVAAVIAGEILLQPNVGIGDQFLANAGTDNGSIDENHPVFTVTSVVVAGAGESTITVDGGLGALNQASENIGTDPIAAAGDSYLIGRFRGRQGEDEFPLDRGGRGANPYLVVNATLISTTGGGGGGGGAFETGSKGGTSGPESDPFEDQRGFSNGLSLDDSDGGSGGFGVITGSATLTGALTLDLFSQAGGRPLAEVAGGELVGQLFVPNTNAKGWLFTIASFDGTTFTLEPIVSDSLEIDLLDGPPGIGPGLGVGEHPFEIIPSLEVGGAGGGGAGVSITGTVNVAPTVLPELAPGAAGGPGGGALVLETARDLVIGPAARILAEGGMGGAITDIQNTRFAGGGGGGGGNIVLRAGRNLQVFTGAQISAAGGEGGGEDGFGKGGTGGGGYIRFEDSDGSLSAGTLTSFTTPTIGISNVGRMVGNPQGVGQSRFYDTMLANAGYRQLTVAYVADIDGDGVNEDLTWSFDSSGADGGPGGFTDPPFDIRINTVPANEQGFLDATKVNQVFLRASDLVSARAGMAYDDVNAELLYCVGESATQIHRLDPVTLAPLGILSLPFVVSLGTNQFDVVSLAIDTGAGELYLLERLTGRVLVIDQAGMTLKRIVTLPKPVQGALVADGLGHLIVADNPNNRLLVFDALDVGAADPPLTDFSPDVAVSVWPIVRDGVVGEVEIVGMAHDPVGELVWCTDAMTAELFQVSIAAGTEGQSSEGIQRASALESVGETLLPSAVAFDGMSLFVLHAVDIEDSTITIVDPGDVSLAGAGLALDILGPLVPEGPRRLTEGDEFIRFSLILKSGHEASGVTFTTVRADEVSILFDNQPF